MSHAIQGILLADGFDPDAAARYDLRPVALNPWLTLFPIDHYFSAYWQAATNTAGELDVGPDVVETFPREAVLLRMLREITSRSEPSFGLIMTEYFGGVGEQWGCAFRGDRRITPDGASINDVLAVLGVRRAADRDEFDCAGLGNHRGPPDYLDRYRDLCNDVGA